MMNKDKATILEFSDSIQDLVSTMRHEQNKPETTPKIENSMNSMEVFDFNPDLESSDQQSIASVQAAGRKRVRGRPPKNLSESTLTDGSTNSWKDQNDSELSNPGTSMQFRGKTKGDRGGQSKVVRRGRSCNKTLKVIEEDIRSKSESGESIDDTIVKLVEFELN